VSSPHTIERFLDVLRAIDAGGFEFAVIGGCAVGAYARLAGEVVFSEDLDLYVSGETLDELLEYLEAAGATIIKRPQPRSTPVAVLDWNGREVNILTASAGLPPPVQVVRSVREIELEAHGVVVPLADPFDLLANKLEIHRDKDLPHIAILRRFVEDEAVAALASAGSARERLGPVRRILNVLGSETLPEALAERLIPFADEAAIRRFLVHRVPKGNQAQQIIDAAPPSEVASLEAIRSRRRFG
jgi:catechol 2,3-dioxygenase-like lactoylglutathione lyase family enzyme